VIGILSGRKRIRRRGRQDRGWDRPASLTGLDLLLGSIQRLLRGLPAGHAADGQNQMLHHLPILESVHPAGWDLIAYPRQDRLWILTAEIWGWMVRMGNSYLF
jgi:hypothetical protein